MFQFDLSDDFASAVQDLLDRRGWLEPAKKGEESLRSLAVLLTLGAIGARLLSTYVTALLEEPADSLPEQVEPA